MAVFTDRIKEPATSTGTTTFRMSGTASAGGYKRVRATGNGKRLKYWAQDLTTYDWEVGEGVITTGSPDTLTRAVVFDSSNGGALVSFTNAPVISGDVPAREFRRYSVSSSISRASASGSL